jgi:hypothetical protein
MVVGTVSDVGRLFRKAFGRLKQSRWIRRVRREASTRHDRRNEIACHHLCCQPESRTLVAGQDTLPKSAIPRIRVYGGSGTDQFALMRTRFAFMLATRPKIQSKSIGVNPRLCGDTDNHLDTSGQAAKSQQEAYRKHKEASGILGKL